MTNEELKQALIGGYEVEWQGIIYKCVSGIIYRNKCDKIIVEAELMDKNLNSVIICDPALVKMSQNET